MTSDNLSRVNRQKCGGRLTDTFNVVSQDPSAGTKETSVAGVQRPERGATDGAMQVILARSTNGGEEKCIRGFGGKTYRERPLGRSRH